MSRARSKEFRLRPISPACFNLNTGVCLTIHIIITTTYFSITKRVNTCARCRKCLGRVRLQVRVDDKVVSRHAPEQYYS
jgi:hypothetical protein